MPLINDQEIDFDSMNDEQLTQFLADLRIESEKKRPRMSLNSSTGEAKEKTSKPAKKAFISVDLD